MVAIADRSLLRENFSALRQIFQQVIKLSVHFSASVTMQVAVIFLLSTRSVFSSLLCYKGLTLTVMLHSGGLF